MTPEQNKFQSIFPEERKGRVEDEGEMFSYLPGMREGVENLTRAYFRGQILIAEGKITKAKRYIHLLYKITGYFEFEQANGPLLAAVDIAVRGETSRNGVKPSLIFNHNS